MKLTIAGKDRSGDIGRELAEAARARSGASRPRFLSPQHSALSLKDAGDDRESLERFMRLLHIRPGLDTADFDVPRKPGLGGSISACIKRFLWKLLRYQHDRMAFQQNVVNELLAASLEFEKSARDAEVKALKKRIADLEQQLGKQERKS